MVNWLDSTIPLLEAGKYPEVVKIYEEITENNPQEINNYWFLGLAYLLNKQEEEAKSVWLMPFLELDIENHEHIQQTLLDILLQEADNQEKKQNYDCAFLIRQEIKDLVPEYISNLLKILNLTFKLNNFNINNLHDWHIIELLKNSQKDNIEFRLIYQVLHNVLTKPFLDSLEFAQAVLINQEGNNELIDLIVIKAHYMAHYQRYFIYSADLLQLCLEYQPDNLGILKELFWYYIFAKDYDKAKDTAHRFSANSKTIIEKIFASYYLLHLVLTKGDWLNYQEIAQQHQNLLTQIETDISIFPPYTRDSLVLVTQPLLYVKDNPREKRPIINHISSLFQLTAQADYSCPIHFTTINKNHRPLKIGYIGHTLRQHSVGWLSRWLMEYHDHDNFLIHTYFINQVEDNVTKKWFKEKVYKATNFGQDINGIVTQIEKDEIDILVDLDSFTLNITQLIMALKPAPIQISWLGMDSTGIPAVDYFIADPYVLPEKANEYYQEKIWRLPHTYLAVDGFEIDIPNISRENLQIPPDAVIYFNIQNALKRHPDMIHVQMKIIKAVPNSYLLIKGNGDQDILKQLFINIAQEEGVKEDRLRFLPETPTEAIHRANLKIADVLLDTYPYNGATTTLETLWMEVPLVTRVGEQFAARNSYTFMINAGITEGIAWTDEQYIEWGVKLGRDENLRKEVSWKLRRSKKTSPLWNGKQFAREMEKAYQQMWSIYCQPN
ncbi:O-linked N-acetylglucosamine transferase, SPINDLY family protein [Cyanobacterium aponinum FACHB-4101]|uniref:O-linked N-acetylglucosamine transferase, SPINDLY family protein n=1 Tax=Cyanobacterium aponinum TaxID=379064 RepID=UPI001681A044|nr:O-linked N-acetylglucosamine transferase, SPINDLY family protein [Cyanobacterium aponinum]MBD2395644.1 O-linked N-acetylglucosamine transferase, SPINDLY family protein [Cyanobacterium aponinum FACHB-4101]